MVSTTNNNSVGNNTSQNLYAKVRITNNTTSGTSKSVHGSITSNDLIKLPKVINSSSKNIENPKKGSDNLFRITTNSRDKGRVN